MTGHEAAGRGEARTGDARATAGEIEEELRELLADGTLVKLDDYYKFVVAEVIAPGIELGRLERREPCRYPAHRPSDWRTRDGRIVCGTCHPPAPGAAMP